MFPYRRSNQTAMATKAARKMIPAKSAIPSGVMPCIRTRETGNLEDLLQLTLNLSLPRFVKTTDQEASPLPSLVGCLRCKRRAALDAAGASLLKIYGSANIGPTRDYPRCSR